MQLATVVASRVDYPEIGKARLQLAAASKGGAHPGTPTWWRAAPRQYRDNLKGELRFCDHV